MVSEGALAVKNQLANAGDTRDVHLIPGSVRAPGEGNGSLLQYSLSIYLSGILFMYLAELGLSCSM